LVFDPFCSEQHHRPENSEFQWSFVNHNYHPALVNKIIIGRVGTSRPRHLGMILGEMFKLV
jgi:hypothetical protein